MYYNRLNMSNIAVFASGSGTNAQNLINYFSTKKNSKVVIVLSNKPDAFVLERARKLSVRTEIFDRKDFYDSDRVIEILRENQIDFIVLAGFLWLVPPVLTNLYAGRIVNIHPALLPNYGGKGMYGSRVHKAVIDNGDEESGITIHFVNDVYDAGDIIFQAKCPVNSDDTPESLAQKIHRLEYEYFPRVVEGVIEDEESN